MTLILVTLFVVTVGTFGIFLAFARPENIERPLLVGALTTLTALISGWLVWLEWHQGADRPGSAIAFGLFAVSGFALGRALDTILGPRTVSADDRQATLGADLSD